jgi:small-conductance mechanosensitive channel
MGNEMWRGLLVDLGAATLALLIAWALSRSVNWFLQLVRNKLVDRTSTLLDDVVLRAAYFPAQAVLMAMGTELALVQISTIPASWRGPIDRIFFALYALLAFLFVYRLLDGLIDWYGREIVHKTDTRLDDLYLDLFRNLALFLLTTIAVIVVLGQYGIEVGALITTLGIGSLAFALAAQDMLGNVISGFTIMIDQPFKVGDRVEILDIDTWGDVKEIGLRSTRIRTRDNRMVSVPNKVIGNGLVVNYSDPNTVYRVQTAVGVAYGTDIEKARRVMIDAIRAEAWVMRERRVEALFLGFGASSLDFTVRCWIEHYVETRRIIDKMNTVLYHALNEAGIEIPFPQRDLHLISSHVPLRQGEDGGRGAA